MITAGEARTPRTPLGHYQEELSWARTSRALRGVPYFRARGESPSPVEEDGSFGEAKLGLLGDTLAEYALQAESALLNEVPPVWTLTNVKYNTYKRGLPEQYTSLATTAQTTVTVNGDTPGAQRLQSAILITDSDDENN